MKDLTITDKGNRLRFKFLDWDTRFFGVNSFTLDARGLVLRPDSGRFLARSLRSLKGPSFVTAKIPDDAPRHVIDLLSDAGFRYMNTEVTLEYVRRPEDGLTGRIPGGLSIEKASVMPRDAYLLGKEFRLTRFHMDENITRAKSDGVWTEYIKNFRPGRASHVFIAKARHETAGIILVNRSAQEGEYVNNLFFVAIKKKFRAKGAGRALIRRSLKWCAGQGGTVTVGTQANNVGALNFYMKNGFTKVRGTKTVLHRWSGR
ncbi:MAG: GNAT family N-acetyltransferase [Candidatus Omnitrophota bacterium]